MVSAQTGRGRHCCRPRCRPPSRSFAASASFVAERSGRCRRLAAVMPDRAPVCVPHGECCCIVMLVASGPIGPGKPFAIVASAASGRSFGALRREGPAKAATGLVGRRWVPSGGWSGSRGAVPSAWRFQPDRCIPGRTASREGCLPSRAVRNLLPSCRSRAVVGPSGPRRFRPTAARHSRHLRFARPVSEEWARRVFQCCCGHRYRLVRVEFT
jgi:hypothetical protein